MKLLCLPPFVRYSPLLMASLLTACQTPMPPLPGPVTYERSPAAEGKQLQEYQPNSTATQVARLPGTGQRGAVVNRPVAQTAPRAGDEDLVSIAIEQTPLPTFLQILYGSVLKMPYTLDPAVMTRTDPVTFKSSQPLVRARVHQLAEGLLQTYGLVVEDFDGLVRIRPAGVQQGNSTIPVLRSSETPSEPNERRPVFHYVELQVVKVSDMVQWLRQMVGTRVTMQEDAGRNAFLLSGAATDVKSAIELIQVMDQPRLRGRSARRFSPANVGAQELAVRLNEVLVAQGYASAIGSVNTASILILPVPAIGGVIVFTHNEEVMGHVQRWVLELDRPSQNAASNNPLFTYPVKYADAQELAKTLGDLLGGGLGSTSASTSSSTAGGTSTTATPRSSSGSRVVVNNATNTLIIRGTGPDEQQQIRQLLRELDRPTKSAMIEVVVAELSLGELDRMGIQWSTLDRNGGISSSSAQFANGALTLNYANSARQIMAAITALATANKGRVLSNPKVMARNGETATITVGREVPVLTGQQSTVTGTSPIGGGVSTGVLQTIQYRNTGVNLKVRPVINSGNRLDLEISQEVSSVAAGETGVGSNPIISNRKIDTKLSLRDGSTILLGGLISRDTSTTNSGVPLLKDIPGVGALFRTKQDSTNQTELLVMITPYVINDDFEAEEITAAMHKTFGDWSSDIRTSRTVPVPPTDRDPIYPPLSGSMPRTTAPGAQPLQPQPLVEDMTGMPALTLPATAPPASESPGSSKNRGPVLPADAGVELSRPSAQPAQPVQAPASETTGKPKPVAPAVLAPGTASPAGSKAPLIDTPAGKGTPVTDPQILEELKRAIERSK